MGFSITPITSNYLPQIRIASPKQVVKNLQKIAVPIIILLGASMAAEAHAANYSDCIDSCNRHRDAHPLAKLICYTMCLFLAKDGK